ncbi:hypothetical protein BRM1_13045 [Brevibacterium sp. BRM-1]|uniref:hypothetical protein n=1 Tax=Brevibacterium sp. BRM-1 TaxID=2999062 RepID=UPI0022831CFA|nr:hypothetical protein [Brevibacterium sp. BRM-1]WAL40134.1 hypothetical protein BRM1_13045 [Brevibacterium sp. BRM-1]
MAPSPTGPNPAAQNATGRPTADPDPRGLYAPGVPRHNGRYDLSELDRQRREGTGEDAADVSALHEFGRAAGLGAVLAVGSTLLVWLAGLGLLKDNDMKSFDPDSIGVFGAIALVVGAWSYGFIFTDLTRPDGGFRRRGLLPLVLFAPLLLALFGALATLAWRFLFDFEANAGAEAALVQNQWGSLTSAAAAFVAVWLLAQLSILGTYLLATLALGGWGLGAGWGLIAASIGVAAFVLIVPLRRSAAAVGPSLAGMAVALAVSIVATAVLVAWGQRRRAARAQSPVSPPRAPRRGLSRGA